MKTQNLKALLVAGILCSIVLYTSNLFAGGLITHIGLAQEIINKAKAGDPSIPSDIASIITKSPETEKAFRSGAMDGDIFNFIPGGLAETVHSKDSASIALALLKNAKTDAEKAYAWGWITHYAGDIVLHPGWVNDKAGDVWSNSKKFYEDTNWLHILAEKMGDSHVLNKYGFEEITMPDGTIMKIPKLDIDISIPAQLLRKAVREAYSDKALSPSALYEKIAELLIQYLLRARAEDLSNDVYPDDPKFWEEYNKALEKIKEWLKDPDTNINQNTNLDDGTPQQKTPEQQASDEGKKADENANNQGPGGDHPDETFDVAGLQAAGEVAFEDWLRLAPKKGKQGAIFIWQLNKKLNEFNALPANTDPVVKEQKRKELIDFYRANVKDADIVEAFSESNPALIEDLKTVEDVAILRKGYPYGTASLLAKFKEPTVKIPTDFTLDALKDRKALVIPTGGLYGLENSTFFKASLDEYVKQGGTLLVFAQQHGYEFSVLPIPQEADGTFKTITGYGWTEDQSCFTNAVYIDTWHQMLAGQSRSTPTLNVDGYFTNYPSNATVILRRTANGQPAMLMYDYGQGKVIVTSMYSDWAYGHSQASKEEIALVRDMISWAKKPATLPEIKPGETVSVTVTVSVQNNTTTDAASVKFTILDPDRNIISEQTVSASVPTGQSTTIPFTYTSSSTSALGIYHIDYTLLDSTGATIQPPAETDSGRFVVSNPPSNPYKPQDLLYSINTPSEEALVGQDVAYTVTIWNNSDKDKRLRLWTDFTHYWDRRLLEELIVPAQGSTSRTYTQNMLNIQGWAFNFASIFVHFFEENGVGVPISWGTLPYHPEHPPYAYAGSVGKRLRLAYPSVNILAETDKTVYNKGEIVNLVIDIQNKESVNYVTNLKVRVSDPSNTLIYSQIFDVSLSASGASTQNLNFTLPSQGGFYTISAEAYDATGRKIGGDATSFELPKSHVSVAPNLSSAFTSGTNTISFTLNNTGEISVSSGTLDVSFKDHDGVVLYTGAQPFSLATGQGTTIDVPINIPPLKFGNYTLTYTQSDETRAGKPASVTIPNGSTMDVSLGKAIYKIGESANIIISINNTGKFQQDGTLTVDIPFLGFTDTKTVTFNPSGLVTIPYNPILPVTLFSGGDIKATFITSGNQLTKTLPISIAPLTINQNIAFDKPSYRIRENLGMNYTITNNGNFASPLNASLHVSIPDVNYANDSALILEPGKATELPFTIPIPETALPGQHQVLTSITLPSGVVHQGSFSFTVSASDLNIIGPGTAQFIAGDTISLAIGNTGGVDTSYDSYIYLVDKRDNYMDEKMDTGLIMAGVQSLLSYTLPDQLQEDSYTLQMELVDRRTLKSDYQPILLNVSGLKGDILVTTDKEAYLTTETTTTLSTIINQGSTVVNGNLHLEIVCANPTPATDIPGIFDIWVRHPDGMFYVERLQFPGVFTLKEIRMPILSDQQGDAYVDVAYQGSGGWVDFLALKGSNGNLYTPWFAGWPDVVDYTFEVTTRDGNAVELIAPNSWYSLGGAYWSGLPPGESFTLIMVAKDSAVGCGLLWQNDTVINQGAGVTQDINIPAGVLGQIGKFYLRGIITNTLGQTIATAEYPFYIVESNTVLLFHADKKIYKPGEIVTITGEVRNLATVSLDNALLELKSGIDSLINQTITVPAGGSHPLAATMVAGTEGLVTVTGTVGQNNTTLVEISDQYEVAAPTVSVYVAVPDVVGNKPFTIDVQITNTGKMNVALSIQSSVDNQLQNITIPAGETKLIKYQQQITGDATYTFIFTGDYTETIQKTVMFGEKAEIQLNPWPQYKEGDITIPYTLKNTGILDASYPVTFTLLKDNQEISKTITTYTLPVNVTTSGSLNYNISQGLYTLRYETTSFFSESQFHVVKPGQGVVVLSPSASYPEGIAAIPYTITNTGPFDAEFSVKFELGQIMITKTAYIQAGGVYSDSVQYDLIADDYTIKAELTSYPSIPVTNSFKVLKEDSVAMDVAISPQTNSLIPVTANLTNNGWNTIEGSVQLSVVSGQGTTVWSGEAEVAGLMSQGASSYTININPAGVTPGDYTLKAGLLNNSNQSLAVYSSQFTVQGAVFQITQLPTYSTFTAGGEGSFTFAVKNTGNQEGEMSFTLKAMDVLDQTVTEWLKPKEEKTLTFNFLLPEDIEEKDYFAEYELNPTLTPTLSLMAREDMVRGQIKYHVAGVNLNVNAALDKQNYNVGDTAYLTLTVTSHQTPVTSQNLFVRINYNGYEEQKSFTIGQGQALPLQFNIPLNQITGEKLFYGIYYESGRSIHLNSLYIYKAGDAITITTDKQVHNPSETVIITVNSQQSGVSGTMTLTGPGNYTETFEFSGAATKGFALPSTMTVGTYMISCELRVTSGELYTASHPIDIAGIQVKVKEAGFDKAKYAAADNLSLSLTIESNQNLSATLKTWIVDPDGNYTLSGEQGLGLVSTEPLLVTRNSSLSTEKLGIHRLVYGIYSGDLLLSSGSEAFDVGDAVLLGVSTDKTDYPENTVPVSVTVSAFGTVGGTLEFILDGQSVRSESVSLSGFTTYTFDFTPSALSPGSHNLKAVLTAGGLTSTKETGFVYGSKLPDLVTVVSGQWIVNSNNSISISTTVTNQGKTASASTDVALYDGDSLIATLSVPALNIGGSAEVSYNWNVLGKTGSRTLTAAADAGNQVLEYNEGNNTASYIISTPDVILNLSTSEDTYSAGDVVSIEGVAFNLSADIAYSPAQVATAVANSTGAEVFRDTASIDLAAMSVISVSSVWDTKGASLGSYTITRTLTYNQRALASAQKTISINNTIPSCQLISPVGGETISGRYTVQWQAQDADANTLYMDIAYSMDSGATWVYTATNEANDSAYEWDTSSLPDGSNYKLKIIAKDGIATAACESGVFTLLNTGALKINSQPAGARVYIDGNYAYLGTYYGVTGINISGIRVRVGKHILRLIYPGYSDHYQLIEVIAGAETQIMVNLKPLAAVSYNEGVRLTNMGTGIDVGNYSTPFVVDWNMDGKKDIIVGNSSGQVLYYENTGTDNAPAFDSAPVTILVGSQYSAPFIIDWDNDGKRDLIIGNTYGEVVFFKNNGLSFEPGVIVARVNDSAIPFVVDWNEDNKKDLLIGAGGGALNLYINQGTDSQPIFNANPDAIVLYFGSSLSPFAVTDWNGDAKKDIIVGNGDGSMYLYLNQGENNKPSFGAGEHVMGSTGPINASANSTPFVVDFNNDGLSDIISGYGSGEVYLFTASPSLVSATIDIDPDTLNKKSKGRWVTCYIELPTEYRVEDIDINSLLLQGVIPAEAQPVTIDDYDTDGIRDLMVKFDRQRLQSLLNTGDNIKVILTGRLKNGKNIRGEDYIRVTE